jgi:Putative transposase
VVTKCLAFFVLLARLEVIENIRLLRCWRGRRPSLCRSRRRCRGRHLDRVAGLQCLGWAIHLGSALTHHPHVHIIVPGGGISPDGKRWVSCRSGFFLPVRVLSRLFRRLFLDKLTAAHAAGRLEFFGAHAHLDDARAFAASLAPCGRPNGLSTPRGPSAAPRPCTPHRVAISNTRLLA